MFKIQLCALLSSGPNKNSLVDLRPFSKYIILLKLIYVFPTSEHQALIYPLGVGAGFLVR